MKEEVDFNIFKARILEDIKAGKPLFGKDGALAPMIENIVNAALEGEMDAHLRSVAAFATLWAEVATPEQAKRMVRDYLFNPKEFWTGAPVAALSRSCPWYTTTKYSSDIG